VLNANDWSATAGATRGHAHYYFPAEFWWPDSIYQKKLFSGLATNISCKHRIDVYPDVLHSSGWYAAREFYFQRPGCSCPLPEFRRQRGLHDSGLGNGLRQHHGMVLPNGSTVTNGIIPSQSLDPGAAALASIWPAQTLLTCRRYSSEAGTTSSPFRLLTTVICTGFALTKT